MKKRTAIGITLGVAGAVVVVLVVITYGMILLGEPNSRYGRVFL